MQSIKITLPDGTSFDTTIEDTALESIKKNNKRWRADRGGTYYVLFGDGDVDSVRDSRCNTDNQYYNIGNYYQTKEQAQKASDKQRAIVKINDRIDELNRNPRKIKYNQNYVYNILYTKESFFVEWILESNKCLSQLKNCETEEIADQIIKELEPELRLVFEV